MRPRFPPPTSPQAPPCLPQGDAALPFLGGDTTTTVPAAPPPPTTTTSPSTPLSIASTEQSGQNTPGSVRRPYPARRKCMEGWSAAISAGKKNIKLAPRHPGLLGCRLLRFGVSRAARNKFSATQEGGGGQKRGRWTRRAILGESGPLGSVTALRVLYPISARGCVREKSLGRQEGHSYTAYVTYKRYMRSVLCRLYV